MPCPSCEKFPAPTGRFPRVAESMEHHSTLYQCARCGTLIEIVEEERAPRFVEVDVAKRRYPRWCPGGVSASDAAS